MKIIVAVDKNGCIGKDGKMPWKCKEDLAHFRETTLFKLIIMGFNTYNSLDQHLSKRKNLVLKREADVFTAVNNELSEVSFPTLLTMLHMSPVKDAFVIGGAKTYEKFLEFDLINELIVTHLDLEVEDGDTFFRIPEGWEVVSEKVLSEMATVKYYAKIKSDL